MFDQGYDPPISQTGYITLPNESVAERVSQVLHKSIIGGERVFCQWLVGLDQRARIRTEVQMMERARAAAASGHQPGLPFPGAAGRPTSEEEGKGGAGAAEGPGDLSSALGSAKLRVLARLPVALSDIASFVHSAAAVLGSSWERLKHNQVKRMSMEDLELSLAFMLCSC